MTSKLTGIDPQSWQAMLLPYPKRFTSGKAIGFCGDTPVGMVETANSKVAACWWPGGTPALLALDGFDDLQAMFARGDTIPGSWNKRKADKSGAVVWRLVGGKPVGRNLHNARFERTWAEGSGGGLVVGAGLYKGRLGARSKDAGLIWDENGALREVTGPEDVCLRATDGTRFAGTIGGCAALWPAFGQPPVDLAPKGMPASEVYALDGDLQIGYAFKRLAARAVIWRGTAESAQDLTPKGYQEARAFDGSHGYQVGCVRKRSDTANGSSACDDHAVIWQGAADRWFDLNAMLPEPFNASDAWAILIAADRVWVCGEARWVGVSDPGTTEESHYVERSQAVVWSARLSGAKN